VFGLSEKRGSGKKVYLKFFLFFFCDLCWFLFILLFIKNIYLFTFFFLVRRVEKGKWFMKLESVNHLPKNVKAFWLNRNHFLFDHYFIS
jgi:hypothetical protein